MHRSTPRSGHLRLVPAIVSLTAPTLASTSSTGDYIRLTYRTSVAGAAGVSVDPLYRNAVSGQAHSAFYSGIALARSGTYDFGRNGVPYTLTAADGGNQYTFVAGVRDAWGNVHWSTTSARTQYPYDDRDTLLRYSGTWLKRATSGTWQGTTSMTRSGGGVSLRFVKRTNITHALAARHFSLVATKAAGGGRARIYVDGRLVATVSTAYPTTRLRQTIWTSRTLSSRTHTLRVVQVGGSGWFRLDGIAVDLG